MRRVNGFIGSFIVQLAALHEESAPHRGNRDEDPNTGLVFMVEETPGVGFLPYGETWARRAPRFDDLRIGTRVRTNPLEKIHDQGFDDISHSFLLVGNQLPA